MRYTVQVIRSDRKSMALQVDAQGQVIVRAPWRFPQAEIDRFVAQHAGWIAAHLQKVRIRQEEKQGLAPFEEQELSELAQAARRDLPARCQQWAKKMGVRYGRITIRSQKTRWGSCSRQGNLNFNCLLMLCPEKVRDYVVVHELCHTKEMNHSPAFWQEVARAMPNYAAQRRWLKTEGQRLIDRLPGT